MAVLGVLLAPATLTFLLIASQPPSGTTSLREVVTVGLPGSILAGTVCGVMNARHQTTHTGHRLILTLASALLYTMMSCVMCAIGCSAAGGK